MSLKELPWQGCKKMEVEYNFEDSFFSSVCLIWFHRLHCGSNNSLIPNSGTSSSLSRLLTTGPSENLIDALPTALAAVSEDSALVVSLPTWLGEICKLHILFVTSLAKVVLMTFFCLVLSYQLSIQVTSLGALRTGPLSPIMDLDGPSVVVKIAPS